MRYVDFTNLRDANSHILKLAAGLGRHVKPDQRDLGLDDPSIPLTSKHPRHLVLRSVYDDAERRLRGLLEKQFGGRDKT